MHLGGGDTTRKAWERPPPPGPQGTIVKFSLPGNGERLCGPCVEAVAFGGGVDMHEGLLCPPPPFQDFWVSGCPCTPVCHCTFFQIFRLSEVGISLSLSSETSVAGRMKAVQLSLTLKYLCTEPDGSCVTLPPPLHFKTCMIFSKGSFPNIS